MKFSIITKDSDNKLHLSLREDTKVIERIQHDVRNGIIAEFRRELSWKGRAKAVKRYSQIPRLCPTAVLHLQDNGATALKAYNGLLLLDVKPVVGSKAQDEVKRRAMALPTTLAAFTGASGRSVKLLVSVTRTNGSLPQNDTEAERFYAEAHEELLPLYTTLLSPHPIVPDCKGLQHAFLMPWDEQPLYNAEAVPFRVGEGRRRLTSQGDWEVYGTYQKDYNRAVHDVEEELGVKGGQLWNEKLLIRLASKLHEMSLPREEAYAQTLKDLYYRGEEGMTERWRTIVDAVYDNRADELTGEASEGEGHVMREVMRMLEQRYQFRHNTIMGYTEYRHNTSEYARWQPVTERVLNSLTMELQLAGLNIWNRDVKRYVDSNHVRDFNMAEDYLFNLASKWDGQDHIRQLARTVPTHTAEWPDWFHRFFLGMVAQWQHRSLRFGNAIVPLLISGQGYHKSDFCRQLLPRELASWGYTDSMTLAEERSVLLNMSQMLLICLDEFNQISPKKQEGFLKNIITLPTVKVKRPYARHVEDLPRLASFIATTNQADVLADPSGSRRFVGIYIDGDIDTSQTPNYKQLYAQAVYELDHGERYWFDDKETEAVMRHNRQFQLRSEALTFFHEYFDTPQHEQDGEWMTAATILSEVKHRARGVLKVVPSVNKFARELRSLHGIQHRPMRDNHYYLVKKLP